MKLDIGGARVAGLAFALAIIGCGGEKPKPATESATGEAAAVQTGAVSGQQLYTRCMTCHQADGNGLAGSFPPLAGSEFATAANPEVPIRVLLHGFQGPVTVKGQKFDGIMPAYGTGVEMTDEEVAAVLTYVRSSFGNDASAITASDVAKVRAATAGAGPMTAATLEPLMK